MGQQQIVNEGWKPGMPLKFKADSKEDLQEEEIKETPKKSARLEIKEETPIRRSTRLRNK